MPLDVNLMLTFSSSDSPTNFANWFQFFLGHALSVWEFQAESPASFPVSHFHMGCGMCVGSQVTPQLEMGRPF